MSQEATGARLSHSSGLNRDGAVHDNVVYPLRILMGRLVCRAVGNRSRIEYDYVGVASFGDSSAIPETEPIGWHAGHLVNGKLQCEHVRLAHVPAEDPWVSAVRAWMGWPSPGTIGCPSEAIIVCGWRIMRRTSSSSIKW